MLEVPLSVGFIIIFIPNITHSFTCLLLQNILSPVWPSKTSFDITNFSKKPEVSTSHYSHRKDWKILESAVFFLCWLPDSPALCFSETTLTTSAVSGGSKTSWSLNLTVAFCSFPLHLVIIGWLLEGSRMPLVLRLLKATSQSLLCSPTSWTWCCGLCSPVGMVKVLLNYRGQHG